MNAMWSWLVVHVYAQQAKVTYNYQCVDRMWEFVFFSIRLSVFSADICGTTLMVCIL